MEDKLITLITGANRGLGWETSKILLRLPQYHIILGSRDTSSGQRAATALQAIPEAKGSVEVLQIDVEDNISVDAAASEIQNKYGRLDILINNAAICPESSLAGRNATAAPSREVAGSVLNINILGAINTTEAMIPLLRKSSCPRLIFVSSATGSLTHASNPLHRLHVAGRTEYRMSKAALNFLMVQYYIALKDDGFIVSAADPGLNATGLTGDVESLKARGAPDPSIGGERIAKVARGERDSDAGKVCGEYGDHDICPW